MLLWLDSVLPGIAEARRRRTVFTPVSGQGSKILFSCTYIIFLIQISSWTRLGKCREDGKMKGTALASSSAAWSSEELGSGH